MRTSSSHRIILIFLTACVLPSPAQVPSNWQLSYYQSAASGRHPDTIDRGIGILSFSSAPGTKPSPGNDTIAVYSRPRKSSRITALFFLIEERMGWSYVIGYQKALQPNILEYDYEECGVPFDSITPSNSWARIILGFERKSTPIRGWVKLDTSVRYLRWSTSLPKHDLFFLDDFDAKFYRRPNGSMIPLKVKERAYIMHPLTIRGPWMQVGITSLGEDESGSHGLRTDTVFAWIRFLRPNGRPAVWYYTRD